jgi:DNA-binding NarL/FixJ family response regulator
VSVWVDDHHPIFLAGLVAALRAESFRVIGSSSSLVTAVVPEDCDVLVFDAQSDDQIATAGRLSIPAVAVVGTSAIGVALAAMEAGVRGLLIRQEVTPRRLASAVRAAHDGTWTCPSDLVDRILAGGSQAQSLGTPLTDREYSVLELLASGLSTQEIAEQLSWSSRTIKNQVQSILTKLGCRNRAQAVGVAVRQGWI